MNVHTVVIIVDDLTLLAPCPSALRKLLAICEKSGSVLRLTFNPDKNQCIRFSRERLEGHKTAFQFSGKYISCVEYVDHLGHIRMILIFRCKRDFIGPANGVLSRFGFCTPEVLTQLLHTYCMSFYGCAPWNLSNRSIKTLDVCINKVLQHIWSLPYNCHTDTFIL